MAVSATPLIEGWKLQAHMGVNRRNTLASIARRSSWLGRYFSTAEASGLRSSEGGKAKSRHCCLQPVIAFGAGDGINIDLTLVESKGGCLLACRWLSAFNWVALGAQVRPRRRKLRIRYQEAPTLVRPLLQSRTTLFSPRPGTHLARRNWPGRSRSQFPSP